MKINQFELTSYYLAQASIKVVGQLGSRTFSTCLDTIKGCKKYWYVVGGAITGTTIGTLSNLWQNLSLNAIDFQACHFQLNRSFLFSGINFLREINPLTNPIYYGCLVYKIGNVIDNFEESTRWYSKVYKISGSLLDWYKIQLEGCALDTIAYSIKSLFRNSSSSIDPSGHIMSSILNNYNIIKCLQSAHLTATQEKIAIAFLVFRSATDYVSTYHTSEVCHSVADVAAAVSIVAVSWIGLRMICKGLRLS